MERTWLKHYDPGVPHEVEIPEKALPEIFEETVNKFPEHTHLKFMRGSLTYREISALADNFAAVLAKLGLKKGSRVALNLPNCPQFVFCYLGALKAGCVVIPCNPIYTERELEHQLNDSAAELMVTLSRFYPTIRKIKEKTRLRTIISTNIKEYFPGWLKILYTLAMEKKSGDRVTIGDGDHRLPGLLKESAGAPVPEIKVDPGLPACIMYTGGTTGLPKGAVLSHRNLVANAVTIFSWMPDAEEGKEIGLALLPFFHSFGLSTCLNLSLAYCGTMLLIPQFDVKMLLGNIHRNKPTLFPGVPTMYIAIMNHPQVKKYDLTSLRTCISGAASLPLEVQKKFQEITGCRLLEGYGLSETSPVTHINPIYGKRKNGSIGIPIPGTLAKIMDMNDPDLEMKTGELGQLAIKGPQVMQGYLNQPEETAKVLRDGWLLTGDLARMDEDGFFYIVDRQKEMIISGGYNIYPREVEEVLYAHEKILEAAVVGLPDPYRGEIVKAYLVLREGETMTEEEVINYCEQNLARYKVPRQAEFKEDLPKSLVGKVLKRLLLKEELSNQESHDSVG
ncbi:MAG: long-chain fatty acid--CoA ligase [Firmicutes bacterium]|nr:long-chain fatty acid--CoA ligase [Bacillota bacterium]